MEAVEADSVLSGSLGEEEDLGTPEPADTAFQFEGLESSEEEEPCEQRGPEEEEGTINLSELNPYILCSICEGYFIDATTITECLHTFCKSCIVRHFWYSNRCPKCNMVVHQTQPLYNIRLDHQLQDIVYKLVVNLEEREKKQIHDFYKERGLEVPKPAITQPISVRRRRTRKALGPVFHIPPHLDISLLLEFIGAEQGTGKFKTLERKYVRVSGEATIGHVEKFLRRKMELAPACQVPAEKLPAWTPVGLQQAAIHHQNKSTSSETPAISVSPATEDCLCLPGSIADWLLNRQWTSYVEIICWSTTRL